MAAVQALVSTKDLPFDDWLAARRKGIGGSDAAAVAGVSRWKSPMAVWLDKTGQMVDQEENEAMFWGREMEVPIASRFARETGLKVRRCNKILQHPLYPFMVANIDREICAPNKTNGRGILEIKTASEYSRDQWEEDGIPDEYYLQCMHYLAITGWRWGYIAALIGGNKFICKMVERDEATIENLIQIEKDFWERYVLTETPPPVDGSEETAQAIKSLYPEATKGQMVTFTPDMAGILSDYDEAKEKLAFWEQQKNLAESKIKIAMGTAEAGFLGARKISWPTVHAVRLDSERLHQDHPELYDQYARPGDYRRFSVGKVK